MNKVFVAGCLLWISSYAYAGEKIHVTLLHFNDVYEITPVAAGKQGGLARLATLRKQLLAKNPHTITTLGGDFFSPSALGTAQYQGQRLAGQQMVAVLNQIGVDYVTFGNHEFDLKRPQFYQRMAEGHYTWVSSNVRDESGKPYAGVKSSVVRTFTDAKTGKTFNLGLFGVTLPVNKPDYVSYLDPLNAASDALKQLQGRANFVLALTHQAIADDEKLVQRYPQINLLLGGHEHENFQRWRSDFVPILKADGNLRSAYIVDLYFDPDTGKTEIKPQLYPIDAQLAEDVTVQAEVDKWVNIAYDGFRQDGFAPEQIVTVSKEALDGLESHVRNGQTNLTQLIARSMLRPYPAAELALYNSGSIRIDDYLPVGEISQYDISRVLPFGGKIQLASIKGSLLQQVLQQGLNNAGSGGYLQSANVARQADGWLINNLPLDPTRNYTLAISDFLASGKEQKLEYLNPGHADFKIIDAGEKYDIRQAVIQQLLNPITN